MTEQQINGSKVDFQKILDPSYIRSQSEKIFAAAEAGRTGFALHLERLPEVAELVARTTRENYPQLILPPHARWRHFQVGGLDRVAGINQSLTKLEPLEKARAKIDLVVISVLLDAGAGDQWRYREARSGREFSRSEGLALASLDLFLSGSLSSVPTNPYRVDATALKAVTKEQLADQFQVNSANPLIGLAGRHALLQGLAHAINKQIDYFPTSRPGAIVDHLLQNYPSKILPAADLLRVIQRGLGEIWPGRLRMAGENLGDVWLYPPLGSGLAGLVPFHKLSQWLTYSLLEPLEEAGFSIVEIARLTGLPEYRNGGLWIDSGVLELRDRAEFQQQFSPGDARIIEWRALTVVLLDRLLPLVQHELGISSGAAFGLPQMLEGGTWAAGRKLAKLRCPKGAPPIQILSDGTVF